MKKKILVGVSGGIACFKAAAMVSKLVQSGYAVRVAMTMGAQKFVTPLTFQALSKEDVLVTVFEEKQANEISHIEWAKWADLFILVPATANIIGKCAQGIADDIVSTLFLAAHSPVWIVPAMNRQMYEQPIVQENMRKLQSIGVRILEGAPGIQACGDIGKGRMMEPEHIVKEIHTHFQQEQPLKGKKFVITAGPTIERIDPVRYITNDSSGKMGYSVAKVAAELGADVTLISGPTNCHVPQNVDIKSVESAMEMFEAVKAVYQEADAIIKVAAVSDYRPVQKLAQKRKKGDNQWNLEMVRNPDILSWLGEHRTNQVLVGFAAETNDALAYGEKKLREKNLDMIVVNDVAKPNVGFHHDTNEVVLLFKDGRKESLPLQSKDEIAQQIITNVEKLLGE